MSTVIRGRARKPVNEGPSEAPTSTTTSSDNDFQSWAQKKAFRDIRNHMFAYELSQGIVKPQEIMTFQDFDTPAIENMVRHYQAQYELNKDTPGFLPALETAIRTNNLDFDFDAWEPEFQEQMERFQDYEVVFFRNRTTAFTLPKPCPNCGQKKLIAEGAVFTRAADEAASQFATCKNCSSRFRLQSVL